MDWNRTGSITLVARYFISPGHDIRYIRMEKVIMEYLDVVSSTNTR